jgi:hypothetical protein
VPEEVLVGPTSVLEAVLDDVSEKTLNTLGELRLERFAHGAIHGARAGQAAQAFEKTASLRVTDRPETTARTSERASVDEADLEGEGVGPIDATEIDAITDVRTPVVRVDPARLAEEVVHVVVAQRQSLRRLMSSWETKSAAGMYCVDTTAPLRLHMEQLQRSPEVISSATNEERIAPQ